MDVKSFMKQCRLCSSFCDTEISIFPENKTGKKSLYSKMATCLPIKVTLDDQLPKNICLTCYRTMESMYKFYVMTVETEKKLYEQLDAIRRAFDYEQGEEIVVLPDCELNTNSIPKLEPIDFIEEVNELSFEDCFLQPDVGGNDEDTSELLNIDKENLSTIDEDKSELITEMDEQKDELRVRFVRKPHRDHHDSVKVNLIEQQQSDNEQRRDSTTSSSIRAMELIFPCFNCESTFKRKEYLVRHFEQTHPLSVVPNDDSSDGSDSRIIIEQHIDVDNNNKADDDDDRSPLLEQRTLFRCASCQYTSKYKNMIRIHVLAHLGISMYKCDQCGRGFSTRLNLTVHQNNHKGLKPFQCEVCGNNFTRLHYMRRHRRILHEHPGSHVCHICQRVFSFDCSLKAHLKRHNGEHRVACDICGKNVSNTSLTLHRRVHSGERPYDCRTCGKSYTNKQILNEHALIHRQTKSFVCNACGKLFVTNRQLSRHLKIHSKSRIIYRCQHCVRTYVSKYRLKAHVRKHHTN